MKTIIKYRCEICNRDYENPADALDCEARGIPEPYPVGMIFNNASMDKNFYADMTFCVAKSKAIKHCTETSMWATRDNGNGDNLGSELCGGSEPRLKDDLKDIPNPGHDTFKRMVDYLKTTDIPITVWNGVKPVPLEEFLKTR